MAKNYQDIYTSVYTKGNKMDFGNAMIRGNGIPLDVTEVYETYADAVSYATTSPIAYEGQLISVTENGVTTVYVVTNEVPEVGLKEVGSMPEVDGSTIIINSDGKLEAVIPEYVDTNTTYTLVSSSTVGTDGEEVVNYVALRPSDATEEDGTSKDLDLSEYFYTVDETNIKIATEIANSAHLKREIVNGLEDIAEPDLNTVYMVLEAGASLLDDDKYAEYMYINNQWERLGAWTVDLSGYAKSADVAATYETIANVQALSDKVDAKVDKVEGSRLITEAEATKLADIAEGAEVNYINSVDETKFSVTDGKLGLKAVAITDVTNLQTELDKKVNVVYYDVTTENEDGSTTTSQVPGTLLSPDDKEKLEALVIGDEGGVEISGKVNASNVEGLNTWITDNRDNVAGLYPVADSNKLGAIEEGAQVNIIDSVNTDIFSVSAEKELDLIAVPAGKITGLDTTLDDYVTKVDFNATVGDLDTLLADVATKGTISARLDSLESALSWGAIGNA